MPRLDTLWVFVSALLVYGLLRQRTFYGPDGYADLRRIAAADWRSDMHLLFKPMLGSFAEFGGYFGITLYDSAVWLSVLGTAIGLAFCHAACRVLRLGRTDAVLVVSLAGLSPAVMFYATVVERHGIFYAFAGLCTWLAAMFGRRPSLGSAGMLALGIIAAYAAHSTGILLLAILVPFALALARRPCTAGAVSSWRRLTVLACGLCLVTLLGTKLTRSAALWLGQVHSEGGNFEWFMVLFRANIQHPTVIVQTAWSEWIYPFMPASLLWLVALRVPSARLLAVTVACGTLVYVFFAFAILGSLFDERGAYLLPLAFPFAYLLVTVFPRIVVWAALLLTASLAIAQVYEHDDHRLDDYALGMLDSAGKSGVYLIVADPVDWEAMFLFLPELKANQDYLDGIEVGGFDLAVAQAGLPLLNAMFDDLLRGGRTILMSQKTMDYLREPRFTQERREAGPLVLASLKECYDFVPVSHRSFHGVRLELRH